VSFSVKPIPVDPTSPVPLYFQAAQHIQRAIETGELPPGSRLDNELLLAEQFGLSRPTMRRAMQYLVDKGLLVRRRGIGTQVADAAPEGPAKQADPSRALTGSSPGLEALGNVAALVNARPASSLTAAEIAAAARTPLTILGRILRETHDGTVLTTQQTFVLSQLMATDALPITDLAEADSRAVSTMAEIVTRMAKAGLVEKSSGADDRRQVLVSITPKGRAAVEGTLRQRTNSLAELIEKLSGEERKTLAAALPALWKLADNDPGTWPRIHVARPPRKRRTLSRDRLTGWRITSLPSLFSERCLARAPSVSTRRIG
jgi:DNA-binding MarR family transcriptional regulator